MHLEVLRQGAAIDADVAIDDDVAIERMLKGRTFKNVWGVMIIVIMIRFRNSKVRNSSQPASQPALKAFEGILKAFKGI